MKKKIFAAFLAATMAVMSAIPTFAAADTDTGLIGHFKFDESLKNEVEGGADAVVISKTIANAAPEVTLKYADGVDGKALMLGSDNDNGEKAGINLNVKPTGKSWTVSAWVNLTGGAEWTPIFFVGSKNQNPENWVGAKAFGGTWDLKGPGLASNGGTVGEATGQRVGADTTVPGGLKSKTESDWLNITIVVDNLKGTIYYNGVPMAETAEDATLPDVTTQQDLSVFLAANAWDDPQFTSAIYDSIFVYDRALSAEDVKALVDKSKTNDSITLKKFVGIIETTTQKAVTGTRGDWFDDAEDDSKGGGLSPVVIGVIVAVVVVVIVAAVAVVTKSKKKDTDNE